MHAGIRHSKHSIQDIEVNFMTAAPIPVLKRKLGNQKKNLKKIILCSK